MIFRVVFAALLLSQFAHGQTDLQWQRNLTVPFVDAAGNRLTGTEVIHIVTHKGVLYAGNSYWNETSEVRRGQVWVKSSTSSNWRLDAQMPSAHSRVPALNSFVFQRNYLGATISPDTILFAGATFDYGSGSGPAVVFMRNDASNTWVRKELGTTSHPFGYTQIRSMGFHRDRVTGIDIVFAGANPGPTGAYAGRYDASIPGKIAWDATPEFPAIGFQRIMGFAVCNDTLYLATQREIYKRIDGPTPSWQQVLNLDNPALVATYAPTLDSYWVNDEDIRGFRTVTNPTGPGQVLLFGTLNHVFRVEPSEGYAMIPEFDMLGAINSTTGHNFHYLQSQTITDIPVPDVNYQVQFIGFEAFYDTAYLARNPQPHISGFASQGYYFERQQQGSNILYYLREIRDPNVSPQPDSLARVRTFAPSPFASERNQVVYAGGFAPWFVQVSNTAWIYRGALATAPPVSAFTAYRNIPYDTLLGVDPKRLSLDVLVPSGGAASKPVIVYVHGGSWRTGDKANTGLKDELFLANDYIFVSLNYRLSPDPPDTSDFSRIRFPDHPMDVAKALAWLIANIRSYGGDTSRIALIGHSAGAHLVSLVTTDASYLAAHAQPLSRIKCVCALDAGAYDINFYMSTYVIPQKNTAQRVTYVNAFTSSPAVWAEASPITHISVSKAHPEFLLVHQGTSERIALAGRFDAALRAKGVQSTAVNAAPLDHEGINSVLGSAALQAQVYNNVVTNFFGTCLSRITTSIESPEQNQAPISIYPNPSSGWLSYEVPANDASTACTLSLVNMTGHEVMRHSTLPTRGQLDLSGLASGIYLLRVSTARHTYLQKVILQ